MMIRLLNLLDDEVLETRVRKLICFNVPIYKFHMYSNGIRLVTRNVLFN